MAQSRHWTEDELARALAMRERGEHFDAIARALGRSGHAVYLRLLQEDLGPGASRTSPADPVAWARFERSFAGVRYEDAAERPFASPVPAVVGAAWLRALG